MKRYSLENFSSGHYFDDLTAEESFYFKKFFGGLSIYVFGRMVAFLCENQNEKSWREKKFNFELWNGCLIPSYREHHKLLLGELKGSMIHPIISKWLYLPKSSVYFEETMFKLIGMIQKKNNLIGIEPEIKLKKKFNHKSSKIKKNLKISKMMNLGPAVEKDFNSIGIYEASEIVKLGPKKAFMKMLEGRLKQKKSVISCNALYLYALYGAIHNIHWTQIPEKKKQEFKTFTYSLRKKWKTENKK